MSLLLEYKLNALRVNGNAEGGFPLTFKGSATIQPGPGCLFGETVPNAVSLGRDGYGEVDTNALSINYRRFHVRILFETPTSFLANEGQTIFFSSWPWLSVNLVSDDGTQVLITAGISNALSGWKDITTFASVPVSLNAWHVVDVVYDQNTVGLFLDELFLGLHAFWSTRLAPPSSTAGTRITVGRVPPPNVFPPPTVQGPSYHFPGQIALVRVNNGIPFQWEAVLDEHRGSPQWYLSLKEDVLTNNFNIGLAQGAATLNPETGAWIQRFSNATLMYHTSVGSAFCMRGPIAQHHHSLLMEIQTSLGFLVADEMQTPSRGGLKSLFINGGIYWSGESGAHETVGQIFLDYESDSARAGSPRAIFPLRSQQDVQGGVKQDFGATPSTVNNVWYHKNGAPHAFEVQGSILQAYGFAGSQASWGFPTSVEYTWAGKRKVQVQQFEKCTVFHSPATGAFAVAGEILKKYLDNQGPDSVVGMPVTNELDAGSGTRVNFFEHGAITYHGPTDTTRLITDFTFTIGTLYTIQDDTGGENEIYVRAYVYHGSELRWQGRIPPDDDTWDDNIAVANTDIPYVMQADQTPWNLKIEIWEWDTFFNGKDNILGTWQFTLSSETSWRIGQGPFQAGRISDKVTNADGNVNVTDSGDLTELQKFWSVQDRPTESGLSFDQYVQTFNNIDSEPEEKHLGDINARIFYEVVYKNISNYTNSVGMILEAIDANRGSDSVFRPPLNVITDWPVIQNKINIKNGRFLTKASIWTLIVQEIGEVQLTPAQVFSVTHTLFLNNDHPILVVSWNGNYSALYPIAWHASPELAISYINPSTPQQIFKLRITDNGSRFNFEDNNLGTDPTHKLLYLPHSALARGVRAEISAETGLFQHALNVVCAGGSLQASNGSVYPPPTGPPGQPPPTPPGQPPPFPGTASPYGAYAQTLRRQGKTLDGVWFSVPSRGSSVMISKGQLNIAEWQRIEHSSPATNPIAANVVERLDRIRFLDRPPILGLPTGPSNDWRTPLKIQERNLAFFSRLGQDFVHAYKAIGTAPFRHAFYTYNRSFAVAGDLQRGEDINFITKNARLPSSSITVATTRPKNLQVEIFMNIGSSGDYLRCILDFELEAADNVTIAPRPGLTMLDIVAESGTATAIKNLVVDFAVSYNISKRSYKFSVKNPGSGVRLKLSPAFSDKYVGVGWYGIGAQKTQIQTYDQLLVGSMFEGSFGPRTRFDILDGFNLKPIRLIRLPDFGPPVPRPLNVAFTGVRGLAEIRTVDGPRNLANILKGVGVGGRLRPLGSIGTTIGPIRPGVGHVG